MNVSKASLTFDERLRNSFECTVDKVYLKFLRYFNIVGQVHSIAITGKRNAYIRIWCGEKMGPEHMAEQRRDKFFRLHKELFQRWLSPPLPSIAKAVNRIGNDCLIEVDVYDEHKESLNFIKSGDFVCLYNVHYGRTTYSEYFVIHSGKKFNRGIFRVPDDCANPDFQKLRRLLAEKQKEAENDEYTPEFIENIPPHLFTPTISDIEFPEENGQSDIDFIKPNNKIIIGGNLIAVDYFTLTGKTKYLFLTHGHSDHTKNLTSKWRRKVYCSERTAAILPVLTRCRGDNGIDPDLLCPLEIGVPYCFDDFTVTLFDANHCIGAVMFLFEGDAIPGGFVLCTGDFRGDSELLRKFETNEQFKRLKTLRLSTIYFDNTYLHVSKRFPDRKDASRILFEEMEKYPDKNIYFPMHRLGREELIESISRQLQEPILVYSLKQEVMKSLGCYNSFGRSRGRQLLVVERNKWKPEEALDNSVVFDITMITQNLASEHRLRKLMKTSHVVHIPFSDHSSRYEIIDFLRHLNFTQLVPIAKKVDLRVHKFLMSFSTCTKNQKVGRTATPPPPNRGLMEMPRDVLVDDNDEGTSDAVANVVEPVEPPAKRMSDVKPMIQMNSDVPENEETCNSDLAIIENPGLNDGAPEASNGGVTTYSRDFQRYCPEGHSYINELPPPTTLEEAISWMLYTPTLRENTPST